MDDLLTVRFRVGAVYKNSFVSVYLDDERIHHAKKRILAPGEMEQVPMGCQITVELEGSEILSIAGNTCAIGDRYARKEVIHPERTVTSTVVVKGGTKHRVSVKTAGDIPKDKIFECMKAIDDVCVDAPVRIGDIIIANVVGTGINVVAVFPYIVRRSEYDNC